ncbi:MAG TPA: cupin-like domain-containing protein [Gemmatimonadales bacterium]|nr:cupin-like domain-containing protein [Gemmatimonadales bacterium]
MTREFPQIERRRGLTPAEFRRQYVQANRPVVLEGTADDWKERWTPELLKERHGDRLITCETENYFVHDRSQMKLPLRSAIDSMSSEAQEYRVRTGSFLSQVPELQEELKQNSQFESFLPKTDRYRRVFWLAPAGDVSSLHHDANLENLNVQVYGRKRFILMPPGNYEHLYSHFFGESPIDPREPDLVRYPKYEGISLCETTLNPGDILYLPQFWWHFVNALTFCININTWARAEGAGTRAIVAKFPLVPRIVYWTQQNEAFERFTDRNIKRINALYLFLTQKRGAATQPGDRATDRAATPDAPADSSPTASS